MNTGIGDGEARADATVTFVPPLVADPLFIEAVDEAIVGDPLADSPEAQPERLVDVCDFPSLYVRHRWALQCHARRFLSDPNDVEDVVQETFLKLFLAIPEIDTELQALAFARRVMTNLCIDRYRAAKRRPSVIDLDQGAMEASLAATLPMDPLVQAEDAAVVREALALLSPLHRAALVKREIEEKSLPVIAAELGIPEESVKHLLYRARRALRRLLIGTSVEPGVDLSARDVAALANRRLGRAALSGANVLIILLVASLTLVGTWRARQPGVTPEQTGSVADSSGAVAGAAGPSGQASTGTAPGAGGAATPTKPTRSHPRAPTTTTHKSPPTSNAPTSTVPTSTVPKTTPGGATQTPSSPPKHQGAGPPDSSPSSPPVVVTPPTSAPPVSIQPDFRLAGSLVPAGGADVSNQVTTTQSTTATALSRFAAPIVGGGSFVLDQTLVIPQTGAPSLQLHAAVQNSAGQALQITQASTQPAVDPSTGSSVAVAGQATAPDGSSVNVLLVYDGTLTQILSETVSVSGLSTIAPAPVPAPTTNQDTTAGNSPEINSSAIDDQSDTATSMKSVAVRSASLSSDMP